MAMTPEAKAAVLEAWKVFMEQVAGSRREFRLEADLTLGGFTIAKGVTCKIFAVIIDKPEWKEKRRRHEPKMSPVTLVTFFAASLTVTVMSDGRVAVRDTEGKSIARHVPHLPAITPDRVFGRRLVS